jgi:hypothetical protein
MTLKIPIEIAAIPAAYFLVKDLYRETQIIVPQNLDFRAGIPTLMRGCTYSVNGTLTAKIAELGEANLKNIDSTRIKLSENNLVEVIGPLQLWVPHSASMHNPIRMIVAIMGGALFGMAIHKAIRATESTLKKVVMVVSSLSVTAGIFLLLGRTPLCHAHITILPPGVTFTRHWLGFVKMFFTKSVP